MNSASEQKSRRGGYKKRYSADRLRSRIFKVGLREDEDNGLKKLAELLGLKKIATIRKLIVDGGIIAPAFIRVRGDLRRSISILKDLKSRASFQNHQNEITRSLAQIDATVIEINRLIVELGGRARRSS